MRIPLLVIVGPTGSGKTDTAVEVALAVDGEVVTADSMQVYRGMDIGTAKPTPEERRGVPHHLIDVVNPDEEFSVAQYVAMADAVIADIRQRGKAPIVSGGTGFYISALIDRWEFPPQPADRAFREQLRAEAAQTGVEALHARLREIDPITAERLHPNDVKRVIRALEVHHLTGKPLSAFEYKKLSKKDLSRDAAEIFVPGKADADGVYGDIHEAAANAARDEKIKADPAKISRTVSKSGESRGPYDPLFYGLTLPREILNDRLEQRVHAQLQAGLLEEVRRLYEAGYGPELSAMKGITYRQLVGYLRGEYDFQTAVDLMVRDNRRYAKRQYTWFNADPRIRWIDILATGGPSAAAEIIVEGRRQSSPES